MLINVTFVRWRVLSLLLDRHQIQDEEKIKSASFKVKSNVHSWIKVSLFSVHLLRLSLFVKSAFSSNIH